MAPLKCKTNVRDNVRFADTLFPISVSTQQSPALSRALFVIFKIIYCNYLECITYFEATLSQEGNTTIYVVYHINVGKSKAHFGSYIHTTSSIYVQ